MCALLCYDYWLGILYFLCFFFFQAEDGIRDVRTWLEFRRVLFRSLPRWQVSCVGSLVSTLSSLIQYRTVMSKVLNHTSALFLQILMRTKLRKICHSICHSHTPWCVTSVPIHLIGWHTNGIETGLDYLTPADQFLSPLWATWRLNLLSVWLASAATVSNLYFTGPYKLLKALCYRYSRCFIC